MSEQELLPGQMKWGFVRPVDGPERRCFSVLRDCVVNFSQKFSLAVLPKNFKPPINALIRDTFC